MILKAILLSITAAAISIFISHSHLLLAQRAWVAKKSRFFGELVECCYCLSHWSAAALMFIMPIALFGIFRPLDYLLSWIVISWFSGVFALITAWLWGE